MISHQKGGSSKTKKSNEKIRRKEVSWTSDKEKVSEDREELMGLGAQVVADIKEKIKGVSRAIKTEFTYGVTVAHGGAGLARSAQLVLLFTITDLGGSEEEHIHSLVNQRMERIFEQPSMVKYKAQWAFEVKREGEN